MVVIWFSLTFKSWHRQMHSEKDYVQYVKGGTVVTHKCVKTESSKLAILTFSKQKSLKAVHFQIDNTTALLYLENGGNREPNIIEIKQRNLAVSFKTPYHNYYRKPSKFLECGGRLAVSKQQGPIRMETLRKSISTSLPEEGNAQSTFVCIKAVSPTTPVLCLETWSFQSGDRCPKTDLGQLTPLCISPILPHSTLKKVLKKVSYDQTEKNVAGHTYLTVSNLVPPSTRNVYSLSNATSKEHKLKKPTRESSSSNCKQNITTSGVDHIRERLLKKGVSETAARLITSTRRKSSESNYNSFWRMWASWRDKQQVDAFRCDVIKILDYLAFLFEKGLWIQDYWMP